MAVETPLTKNQECPDKTKVWERKFILVTLSHAEKRSQINPNIITGRILDCFPGVIVSIIICKERHESTGFHYHIGILSTGISKFTFTKTLSKSFPEFEGSQFFVKFHKCWGTICCYVTKEDSTPFVWGEYTLAQIKEVCKATKKHKKQSESPGAPSLLAALRTCENWYQVYENELLCGSVLRNYNNIRNVFEDLQIVKSMKSSVLERLVDYLYSKSPPGSSVCPREYSMEELKEKYHVLDWIACQVCWQRPLKTKQLFIYGAPSTQKTLLFHFLSNALRIYFGSSRKNDFTGAHDFYDLWIFDEFHEPDSDCSSYGGYSYSMEGTPFANTLLKMLDGQECRLDSKYGKVLNKKRNVPIVMISNVIPSCLRHPGAFQERFMRIPFRSNLEALEEERVISTLYGCIKRRISRSLTIGELNCSFSLSSFLRDLTYNKCELLGLPRARGSRGKVSLDSLPQRLLTSSGETVIVQPTGEEYRSSCFGESNTPYLKLLIDVTSQQSVNLSLIDYLIIPLVKPEVSERVVKDEVRSVDLFQKGVSSIYRFADDNIMDYASFPATLVSKDKTSSYLLRPSLYDGSLKCEGSLNEEEPPLGIENGGSKSQGSRVGDIHMGALTLVRGYINWSAED
jgi:hypothetical protein